MSTKKSGHRWKFNRVGGVEQVVIHDGADIIHLEDLDQKLWAALACPVKTIEFDSRTLELLDLDKDGRLRAPEILAISRWVRNVFRKPDVLIKGSDSVSLEAINPDHPEGASLLAAARRVLKDVGKPDAESISLADVAGGEKALAAQRLNGDGIVTAESAADQATNRAIGDILTALGSVPDRSGKPGINQAKVDSFFDELNNYLAWNDRANEEILPLGEKTAGAADSTGKVRDKIDDYFARCRLVQFDPRAAAILNEAETDFKAMNRQNLKVQMDEIARLPLAAAQSGGVLPLDERLNPAWRSALQEFRKESLEALAGAMEDMPEGAWLKVRKKLTPYFQWKESKPATSVEKLGVARLRELQGSGVRDRIVELIQKDAAENLASDQLISLEKMVRVQRDLLRLLNNFVSFSDFYHRRGASFQIGTLYIDGRSCELCVPVADPSRHVTLAGLARMYLAYCECTRLGEKMTIAAAVTAGDSDHLMVGRNGLFYDRKGRDWDATITKIIENPISLWQAFWAPYKKFVRMIEEQVAKRAAAADSAAQAKLGTTATHLVQLDPGKPAAQTPAKKTDVGTVAAIGVALGSIGTFLGILFGKFVELGWWIPIALGGLMLAISGPSVLIAWLKLRQRSLGPILDANGWAVNGRMRVNVPFGKVLSKRAKIPPGSTVHLKDPFAEDHSVRNRVLLFGAVAGIIFVLWRFNLLNNALPERFQHQGEVSPIFMPSPK